MSRNMENTKHQTFRQSIALPNVKLSHVDAFKAIEYAIETLNKDLERACEHGFVHLVEDPETGSHLGSEVYLNPIIVDMQLIFLRDTGRFNGCTGEIMSEHEDRYHSILLKVTFKP